MDLSLGGGANELYSRGSAPSMPPARAMYDRRLQNVVPMRRHAATRSRKATASAAAARGLQLELKLRARRAGRPEQRVIQCDMARRIEAQATRRYLETGA